MGSADNCICTSKPHHCPKIWEQRFFSVPVSLDYEKLCWVENVVVCFMAVTGQNPGASNHLTSLLYIYIYSTIRIQSISVLR